MFKLIFHPRIVRLYLLGLLLAVGMGALLVRLWSFQVERREEFVAKLPSATTIRVREPAVRGEIRDCNGLVLATNERNYALVVNLGELREFWQQEWNSDPSHPRVRTLRNDLGALFDEYLRPRLEATGVPIETTAAAVDRHWKINKEYVSMVLHDHLSWEQVTRIAVRGDSLPGVRVVTRPQRRYPFGALGGHVVGYLRPGTVDDLTEAERREFKFDLLDDVGVAGVEAAMDDILSGTPGVREILQDVNGRVVGEISNTPPVRGDDVYLTLDLRMQFVAERALRDAGVGQGAAVVIDPRNGGLLAMASIPSFDPNHFVPSVDPEVFRAYGDPHRFNPLLAQAVRPAEPGSTFKVPIAVAGSLSGIDDNSFSCSPLPIGRGNAFRCWILRQAGGSHGTLNLPEALKVSCNGFFYRYADATETEDLTRGLMMQGMGRLSGVELKGIGEAPGIVIGTPEWRRAYGHADEYRPTTSDKANTGIGQGGVLASPLQMAGAVATIANGGTVYQTRVVSHAIGRDGQVTFDNLPHARLRLQDEGVPQHAIDTVREGMWRVVNAPGGTGRRVALEDNPWIVCGKTGTAQTPRKDRSNAWFICFAPFDHGDGRKPRREEDEEGNLVELHDPVTENKEPRYAICTLVRNGKAGGTVAAPIAKRILEGALALERRQPLNIGPLDEAMAHDNRIDLIDYGDGQLADFGEVPVEDGGDDASAPEVVDPAAIEEDDTPLVITDEGFVEPEPVEE